MIALWELDLDKTIQSYNYTVLSAQYMDHILRSEEFADMDTESITKELFTGFRLISFKDHLKRYVYFKGDLKTQLNKEFSEVTDQEYKQMMIFSFNIHRAPVSVVKTSTRLSAAVSNWLTKESVKRNTIFTLGFGLGMTEQDVSEFLTKVLREEDFDFTNPEEVIYWYCYHFNYPFLRANALLEDYQSISSNTKADKAELKWDDIYKDSAFPRAHEKDLKRYLAYLKQSENAPVQESESLTLIVTKDVSSEEVSINIEETETEKVTVPETATILVKEYA